MHIEIKACPYCGYGVYARGPADTVKCKCGALTVEGARMGNERTWRNLRIKGLWGSAVLTEFIDIDGITERDLEKDIKRKSPKYGRYRIADIDIDWKMFNHGETRMMERVIRNILGRIHDKDYKIERIFIERYYDYHVMYAIKFDWSDDADHSLGISFQDGIWDELIRAESEAFEDEIRDVYDLKKKVVVFMR
jgi:hypothetical protein